MLDFTEKHRQYRAKLEELSREDLLELINAQDPQLIMGITRIEWVFENKLKHLNWNDGTQITERPLTKKELATLIDIPFEFSQELAALGIKEQQQREMHIASDPVLWAKTYLGVMPRVYQILILREPSLFIVLRAGRRLGKALDLNTPIATTDGWKTMGSVEVGDRVFDEKGKPCNITYVAPIQHNRICYDVIFSDGSKIKADADHLWITHTKRYRKALGRAMNPQSAPSLVTTQEIRDTLRVGSKEETNHAVPVARPVQYPERDLAINPYTLGVWLGDGVSREASISIHESEMAVNIKEDGYELTQWQDPNMYTIHGISSDLKKLNLINNKHIPQGYLIASEQQRRALLEGLMDSDGSVRKSDGYCEFSVKVEALARGVHELAASLGLRPTFREGRSTLYGRDCGPRYRVGFTPNIFVFRLMRKILNQTITNNCQYRYIVDVKETESVPVRCIEVDSPSHLFLAGKEYIPTHNTWTMAVMLLWYSYITKKGRCLVVTPMKEQAILIYNECLELARKSGIVGEAIIRQVKSPNPEIGFTNQSTIKFFTSGMKSGLKSDVTRGQEAHMIILDELDYMGEDDMDALMAMLQRTDENQPDKRLIAASTPSGRKAKLWEWCHKDNIFKSFWFPSYMNPNWDSQMEEFFRDLYTEIGYRHEIEADWGEDADGVYPRRYVDRSFVADQISKNENEDDTGWSYELPVGRFSDPGSFTVFGVDWDKYGAGTNIVVLQVFNSDYEDKNWAGRIKLLYREETLREEYTLTKAVDRIIYLNSVYNPNHIYVDRGFGEVQVELLKKYGTQNPYSGLAVKLKGISFAETIEMPDPHTGQKQKKDIKPFMVDTLRQYLEKGIIKFSAADQDLHLQLISYIVARITPTGRPVFEMSGNNPDHCHDALILATLAIKQNYDDLMRFSSTNTVKSFNTSSFDPLLALSTNPTERAAEQELIEDKFGSQARAPVMIERTNSIRKSSRKRNIRRGSF